MPLKLQLKPDERLILGGAVITNGPRSAEFIIENKTTILRQGDIMSPDEADSPCRKIYFMIQMMYVDEPNLLRHHKGYWELVREVVQAAPGLLGLIDRISGRILAADYYQALKLAKTLIEREQELIAHAKESDRGV